MRAITILTLTVLLSACASQQDVAATNATIDPSHPDAMVSAALESGDVQPDDGASAFGFLSVADAGAMLATYEDRPAATNGDLTRAVSHSAEPRDDSRRIVTALRLRNGQLLAGRAVSDDGRTVEFEFETPEGIRGTTSVKYAALHPESVADLMLARTDERDAGSLMDVAEYATANGLYEVARISYLAAVQSDPSVASVAEQRLIDLSDKLSKDELLRGKQAVQGGNDVAARRILRRVQREFAGSDAAAEAARAVEAIDARLAQNKLDATRAKRLAPIEKLYEDSIELTDAGLARADKPTTAIRSFLSARTKTTSARRKVDAAHRSAERSGDAELVAALDAYGARLDMQERDNEIQLATSYLDKSDYQRARAAARAALALDREDAEALALLTRINEAEEESRYDSYDDYYNGYWRTGRGAGWNRWRRRRPYPYPRGWYPGRGPRWGGIRGGAVRSGGVNIGVFRRGR